MATVVLASHNKHKLEELQRILAPLVPGIELLGYDGPEPIESGLTFEANALLKARAAAAHTGLPAIADDSGLTVSALNGCPGIFSARWAGPSRSDVENVDLLLWQMNDVRDEDRAASFVCAAALALPPNGGEPRNEIAVRGEWMGSLLRSPRGGAGFGYDPVFLPSGESRSAAELSAEEKDARSHRRAAFSLLAPELLARLGRTGQSATAEG